MLVEKPTSNFFSSSGITNHNDFDMALFTRITEVICGSECESIVKDMRHLRNEECHRSNKEVPNTDFDNLWKCTGDVLEKCIFDLSLVNDLKDGDPFLNQLFQDIVICIQGRRASCYFGHLCYSAKEYILLV